MPLYEMVLVVRPMAKQDVLNCLKRTAEHIWNRNGVLRKIDYMGFNKLPYSRPDQTENKRITSASYFIYHISLKTAQVFNMKPELKLDLDIVKAQFNEITSKNIPADYECTLEDELQPPALRKSVQPLLEEKNVRANVRKL